MSITPFNGNELPSMENFNAKLVEIEAEIGAASSAKTQIVTGSYVGTGTHGASNPNTLTFGFAPKFVAIVDISTSPSYVFLIYPSYRMMATKYRSTADYCVIKWEGSRVSWYTLADEYRQFNEADRTYCYVAIG